MSNKRNQRLKKLEREVARADKAERLCWRAEYEGVDKYYQRALRKRECRARTLERRNKRKAMEQAWWDTVNNNEYIVY